MLLGVELDQSQVKLLLAYLQLLEKWNQHYNLTAIKNPEEMISKHVLDSLSIEPYLEGRRILDVGSGAGLPGIPLAVAHPGCEFVLLDSNAKKTRFLFQASVELGLSNISVVCERVEVYRPSHLFDTIVTRAFTKLVDFVNQAEHLCKSGGCLLAMKGKFPQDELKALPVDFGIVKAHSLSVPEINAQRHLVKLRPRRAGDH